MNLFGHIPGRRVGAALLAAGLCWGTLPAQAEVIATWTFDATSEASQNADSQNANLNATLSLTRGAGAAASAGGGFRTVGFRNDGISTGNTDYYQIVLQAASGYTLSLTNVFGTFVGTASFSTGVGVSHQWAYSLDGSSFTLIGSAQARVGNGTTAFDFSAVSALQDVANGTDVTLRYYASGRTSTGGWGFNSQGFTLGGSLDAAASATVPTLTSPTATSIGQTAATLGANVTDDGGATVTSRGTYWGTTTDPSGNGATSGSGTGVFTHERTGLSQGTKYFYRGYAVNSEGTGYSPSGSFHTEPAQATGIGFASVGSAVMTISWTVPASADGVIVVMRAGNSAVTDPTDGVLHSANAAFGSGANLGSDSFVVYRGSGTSVEVTSLSASTTYYVEIFAYKGTVADSGVDQGINYRQTSPLADSQATAAANSPASIITQPDATYAGCAGSSVNLTVTASGTATIEYAWRKRGAGWGNSWSFTTGSDGGVFLGNNQSSIDTSSKAWGLWANNGYTTEAKRDFAAMDAGDVFYVEMDNGGVGTGSVLGFSLQNSSGTTALEFYFQGGNSNYTINRNGGTQDSGIGWSNAGLLITITNATSTTYSMMVTVKGGSTYGPFTGTYMNSVSSISRFRAFSYEASGQSSDDLFFNSLKVGPFLTAPFYDDTAAAYSTWTGDEGQGPLANGGDISGATSDTLTISNLESADNGTYDVVVYNDYGAEVSSSARGVLTVNVSPTITLGASPSVYRGTTSANLPYSGTSGTPNQYAINFDAAAESAGFADVSWTALGASPIALTVPAGAAPATYNGTITVRISGTGCESAAGAFTVTVSAINNPSGQSATRDAVNVTSEIDLAWTRNAQTHNVMVVRKTSAQSWTEPTQGTGYIAGNSIGAGVVVYNGALEAYSNTGLTPGTTYDYKFYSINNNYYSAGVTAQASTLAAPTVSTTSATPSTPADPTQAQATGNVSADGGSTVTERGIVWQSTAGDPDTSDTKVAHGEGGTGSFTVTLTGLAPGQTVYYRAYAINGVDTSYGTTLNFTADCFTNGPGILAGSAVGTDTFTANWEAVAGATGYELDVMTDVGGGSGANSIEEDIQDWTTQNSYGNHTQSIPTGTVSMTACIVQPSASASGDGSIGRVQMQGTTGIIELPSLNTAGTITMTIAAGGAGRSATLQRYNGSTWDDLTTWSGIGTTGATFDYELNSSDSAIVLRLAAPSAAIYVHDIIVSANAVSPTYVDGYENRSVGNVTSLSVTGLTAATEYFYRVRATNDFCTSDNSETTNVTTIAGTPSVTLADNGTQIGAANVAAGTANHVLHTFSLAVSSANATLTGVGFTSAGTYAAADLDNFKVWYSADATLNTGSDTLLGTISADLGTGAHSLSGLNQAIDTGNTGYIFITADFDAAAAAGKTINIAAVDTDDVTFASANKSGSTTAGGSQTITSAVTISLHASSPAAGTIEAGANTVVLFGFTLTPASGSFDFTGLVVDIAGTATSGDLSNFEIVYDANGDGVVDGGESVVSDMQAIGATITFTMSGQTGISAARSYLLIADVAATPTAGRTITASVDTADVTTTGTESGDADGAQQTIITVPILTTPTATAIGQTAATLGATITGTGGAAISSRGTVYGLAANPTGNGAAEGDTATGAFSHERSSLSQGTRYFYRGYAVNSVGTGYSPDGSFHTEPGQAADVTFANVTATGMRISWTAGADSDGAIVVVRATSAVADGPVDGTTHSASTTFGSGANLGNSSYVVHRGAGTQVDVTGLTAGTTYHVAVYAFKGTVADSGNDLGINYRQTSPATGNKPTLAAEPTTDSSSLSFSNIGAYSMDLSWTSGNGASRIVVVRQGSATSWTPADGTAPSGVSADFSAAADQASGNKIAYSGSGNSFTLSGLDPETTYHVTIFEYNGSGTEVNYYLGGTPLSGNETTGAETCTPAEVVLIQQAAYYSKFTDGGDIFDNGGTELGMWAHGGNKQVAAWRTFNTSGNGSGDARALEPGDRFQISVHGYSPFGILGMSLNDGAATGSWANRHSNTRGYLEAGNGYGDLYVTDANGAYSWSGIRPWNTTITMEFHVLSSKEFTANIVGQTPYYDRTMLNSPGDTDRIDGFSIYYHDDWADGAERNAYWKQDTTITNLGYVEFGADNGTRTISGKITDGTNPHCPEVPSPNFLKKSGSGAVTLGNTNTYTLYTDIAGGTLQIYTDSALGTAPATPQDHHVRFSGAGTALAALDTFTLSANRGLTLSNWAYLAVADTKVMTYNGVITDGAGSYNIVKNQAGELVLGGNNTYDNGTYIDHGTLTLAHANAAGTGGIFIGRDSGSESATLKLGLATTFANNVTVRTESSGIKYLAATETATLSGTLAIAETDDDRFTIDVASGETLTVGGTVSGDSGGGKITKTGAGTLVFSGTNTHDKKVQINEGTVAISASRNLGADPAGAYADKITLHGGTLQATATFSLHQHYSTTLGANNGFIEVDDGFTLTVPAAISGSGGFGKTGTGTLLLTGANTFSGPMTNSAGTVQIGNNGTVGSISANIVNNAALVWHRSDNVTYSGQISGTGTLTKNGAGTLTLSGTSSMSGATTVSAGTLLVSGSLANSEVTVSSGATLMGAGTVGDLVIGGTVDPGNSAAASATLTAGAVTLQSGGAMRVDMGDVDGVAGTDWDLIDASGTITVNDTGTFTIYLYGASTGFDSSQAYEWTIVDGTVSGFDAGSFAIDTSNFAHDLGGGTFSIVDGSLKLKFTPRTPDAPAALTATATGPDSIQLAFTLNASNDPVVIVFDMDGTFTDPSGTIPAAGNAFAGGTVVYAGATSPQNHTGLDACDTYYYKMWSYNGTNFSATGATDDATTDGPDAVTTVWASVTNQTDFTAAWDAAAGATSYRVDVSTNETFGGTGGGSVNLMSNAGFETGDSTDWDKFETEYSVVSTDPQEGTYHVAITATATRDLTQNVSITGDGTTEYEISYWYKGTGNTRIWSSWTTGGQLSGDSLQPGSYNTATSEWTKMTYTVVPQSGANVLFYEIRTYSGASMQFDNFFVGEAGGGGSSEPSYVAGYSNLLVSSGTSQSVTGLVAGTEYFFRVRADGVGGCPSDNSPTGSVTTLPPTPSVVLADNGTQIGAANVAQGATAHVLHKFQLTVSDANATLTGVSFTTAGTYDAADIDNFRVWYSADNAFDSGADTSLGSISTSLGTGAHSLSSLSQAINSGNVGYIFITADFDAAATVGNTINVTAVETNDLTFTTAAISGSTTAGGAQTIISGTPSYTLRYTGFEGTTADNWSWVPSTLAVDLGPRTDDVTGKTGDYSLMLTGSQAGDVDPYILFDNVTIPDNAQNIELSIGYAARGADANDDLFLDVSYDNGSTWGVSTQLVDGFSGLDVDFGETVADRTAGANPYVLSIPDDTAQVRVRIRYDEAAGLDNRYDEYYIDEVKLVAGIDYPSVSWASARTVTNESDTTQFNIPVSISQAADATVQVAIAGTALPGGVDFTAASTTLVFTAAGATTQNLQITINNDSIAEGVETVRFTLVQPEGAKIAGPDVHTLFIRDDDAFTLATVNLTSGTLTVGDGTRPYDDPGQRLLKALLPDVVAIQEWVVTNGMTNATFVSSIFGDEYEFYVEPESDTYAQPNGIISRWPITASGQWADGTGTGARDYAWATIDLPGAVDLNVVSVHFKAGDAEAATREAQARELTNYIANAGFDAGDYLVIAGDLNLSNRTEAAMTVLLNLVSDDQVPTDKAGDSHTNPSRIEANRRPYDYLLPNAALELQHTGMSYNGTSFANGFIFDSREWGDHQYPALGSDSEALNLTHRPVLKVYSLTEFVAPPASLTATADGATQIDLAFQTNAAGDTIVIVYDLDGSFTAPSGAAPSVDDAFAGGTVLYVGTGSSYNHTGLDACTEYFYQAWSVTSADLWSEGIGDSELTDAPAAPASVWASATNFTDFTAAWDASSGATGYRVDVSTSSNFTGGGLSDDFTDGNFSSNLEWSGDTSSFMIITDLTLPGGNASTDGSFLGVDGTNAYSALSTPCEEVNEWNFSLGSTDYAPSSANYFGVVLMASAPFTGDIATNNFQGYYLRIGVDGTTDYIELWRKTGVGNDKVGDYSAVGNFGSGALRNGLNIRITRNASGEFTLYHSAGFTYDAEPTTNGGTLTNAVYDTSSYFGIYGRFANNGTTRRIYFDNFQTGSSSSGNYVAGYEDREVPSGTNVSVTGLVENTTYYFRVRTEGGTCVSANSPTGTVTTRTSTVLPPDPFTATMVSSARIDLAFTPNGDNDPVVIVFNTTGYGDFEAPSNTIPAVGQPFAGGTLLYYDDTDTSYEHTGLDPCTVYYYRAWSYNSVEEFWSVAADDDAETDTPDAPATVWASVTNYTDFTAAWDAVSGAAGYYIDVSESETFAASGGESTRLVVASNAAAGPAAITNEWSGYNLSGSTYVLMIQPTSVITSPAFSTVNFTNLTVDYRARTYGGANATYNLVTVSISTNDGATWSVMGTGLPTSTTLSARPTLTNTTDLGHAQTRIRWQTLGANGSIGAGVDQLVVRGWQTSSGSGAYVPGYENLYVDAATSVSVTGLAELVTYYFRVRATAGVGCTSGNSDTGEVTTLTGSPFPPTALTASDGDYTDRVALLWGNVADETGYTVFRHTLNLPASATVIGQTATDVNYFDDTTADPGQIYYYWVAASNAIGSSAKSSVDSGYRRVQPPTDVAASDGTSTVHVEITWTGAEGATSYQLFRHTNSTPAEGMASLGSQSSGYLDTTAIPGQQYWYWVQSSASSSSSTSNWSTADGGYRRLATVAGLTASYDEFNDRIELDWTDVTGETGFGIWRNTVNDPGTATHIHTTAANAVAYDDTTGLGGIEYFYWVTATNTTSSSMGDFQANGALGRMLDPNLPIVLTTDPSLVTASGANGGGDVINEGTSDVTARGVVWSTSQNPTVADSMDTHAFGGPGLYTNYLSGLVAGQTYYVRAYAVNSSGTVYGGQKSFTTPCFSGVVTGLFVNPTNGLDFTAQWAALPGATGYRLDVSTNEYFVEGSSVAEVISENFAGFTTLNGSTDRSGTLDTYMQTAGWTGTAVYENQGEAKMGSSSVAGALNTPVLDLSANGGQATLTFDARRYGTDTPDIYISVSSDGVTYHQSGDIITLGNDMTTYTNLITNGTASCRVRITATFNSSKRFYLDNWRIEQGTGEPSFVPGYSNLAVLGTSQMVTNLSTNTWYYFRVRAEGAGACLSDNSATEPVQTRDLSPSGPGNMQASDGTFADKVQVTWDAVDVATEYAIYRNSDDDTFEEAVWLATVDDATVLYDDTTAVAGQGYWYWVVASNEYGTAESLADLGYRGMEAVANVDATDGTHTDRVVVTWDDLDGGETGYAIWRSETSSTSDAVCVGAALADSELYDDEEAVPGQQYWYWVRATNTTSGGMGAWGTADEGHRKLAVVADLSATYNTYDDRIQVSWSDSTGETAYSIWRNTADNFASAEFLMELDADTLVFDDSDDVVTGQPYWYWVLATNSTSQTQSDPQDPGALGRRAQTPPVVVTLAISNNIKGSALGGGDIMDAGGSSITNRGLVWNTTGNPTIIDSHVAVGAGAGLGTYSGTISPTLGNVVYYVRAYAQNEERIAYGQVVSFVGECIDSLPATLAASDVDSMSFVANWTDVTVPSYRLDVSTNATFLGGYDANVAALHNGVLGEGTGGTWVETNILQSAGYLALRVNTAALITPAIDFDAGSGETLTFRARIFGGGGNGDFRNRVTVSISTNNGVDWEIVGTRTPVNTTLTAMEPLNLSAYNGTQVKVKLDTRNAAAGVGAGVVDVAVTNLLDPRGVYIGGYSNRTVGTTYTTVTGLFPEVTYYYRVRAYESDECTSGDSDVRTVTTMAYESTWDGGGGMDRNWTTAANWDGNVLPQTNATVYFYSGINGSSPAIFLDGDQVVKGVRFTDDADDNVNINDNTLTIFSGGIGIGAGAGGNLSILSALNVAAAQAWTNASPNDFLIEGAVGGTGAIGKHGEGRIVLLNHDSTFSGAMTIHEGALQIRGTNALGTTGASAGTTVAGGAALELHGGGAGVSFDAEPLTISGTGVSDGGALRFVQNNVTFRGPITLAADARIQAASNSPAATGAIAIGANTLSVGVATEATELRLGGAMDGTRSAAGEYAFVKDGASRLLLTGNNQFLTGNFHFQEGEIRLGSANAMGQIGLLVFGNNTVMKSSSVADYEISRPVRLDGNVSFGEAATRTGSLTFGGDVDLGGATRTIAVSNPITKWVEFVGNVSNGNLTKAGPGMLVLSGTTADGVGLSVTGGTLEGHPGSLKGNIANNGLVIFRDHDDGTYAGNMSGSGSLEKSGFGRLTLTGTSTHSGITMINEGLLLMEGSAADSAFVVASGGALMGEGTVGDLLISGQVHPGASSNTIGVLNAEGVYLSGGGTLRIDMTDVTGTAGTDWDLLQGTGGITVNATEGNPFRIELVGDGTGFDPDGSFSWKIVDGTLPATGWAPNKFTVDHSGLANIDMQGGSFMVAVDVDGDLAIQFQLPGIAVLGIDGSEIADGDSTPSWTDGTDFGLTSVGQAFLQTFMVTNNGLAPVQLENATIDDATGFFTVSNQPPALIEPGGIGYLTIAYEASTTGTNTATVYITNNVDGKSPYNFDIRAVAGIAAPSNLNVAADLHEMVRLDWTRSALPVILLHRSGAALTGGPVDGTTYSVGNDCGGGKVLYMGTAEALDHEVPQNSTNFYAIHSVAGSGLDTVYSMGVTTFEAYTPAFLPAPILEPFSRTNGLDLNGLNRGQKWSGAWSIAAGSEDFSIGTSSLKPSIAYPPVGGNSAQSTVPNGDVAAASRNFASTLTTDLYLSWVMRVENPGSAQYAGIEVLGASSTPIFRLGLPTGSANAGIQRLPGGIASNSALAVEAGVDYTYVAKMVKSTKTVYLLRYTTNDIIRPAATDEPALANWHAVYRMADLASTDIYGLKLAAGGNPGPAAVQWDEIRVANNWTNLFDVGRQPVWDGDDNNSLWFKANNWVGNQLPKMDVEVTVFYERMGRSIGEANNVGEIQFNGNAGNHYEVLGLRFDSRQTNGVYIYGQGRSTVMELSHQGIEVQAGTSNQTARGTNTLAIDQLLLLTPQPWTSTSTNAFTSIPS
jgi:autotransporter-associated beta strand protein